MSMDADEKAQSKFPRASLRARNKTLMMTPADVDDFQITSKQQPNGESDLADVFGDSLSSLDEGGSGEGMSNAGAFDDEGEDIVDVMNDSSSDGMSGLSEALELEEERDADRTASRDDDDSFELADGAGAEPFGSGLEEISDSSALVDSKDIFAAPAVRPAVEDELFAPIPSAPAPDPIVRGTRSAQGALGSLGALQSANDRRDNGQGSRVVSSLGGSALRNAAQSFQGGNQKSESDEAREYVDWKKQSKLVGFLVSYATNPMGRYIELREGRLLVTSGEHSSDSCLVILDESVSPMHAIMRVSADGAILILDQLSEHGTRIRRAEGGRIESLMGDKSTLCHGDVVIFGECEYHVVVMGVAALKRDE